jgi:hypothetical protein
METPAARSGDISVRHPAVKALYDHWNSLHGARGAPTRAELAPERIAPALGNIFLLDGIAEAHATESEGEEIITFRLAGSRLIETLGRTLTGEPFASLWQAGACAEARAALRIAAGDGEPVLIGIRAYEAGSPSACHPSRAGRQCPPPVGAGEMLLLPLSGPRGPRLVGAMALFGWPPLPVRQPHALDISGMRIVSHAARCHAGTGLVPGHVAEDVIARRGHLAMIRGIGAPTG